MNEREYGWAKRFRDRLPKLKPKVGPTGPSVDFDRSRRAAERDALRELVIKMSRRRVLWEATRLEVEDAAHGSASELLRDAESARLALPHGSQFDPLVGRLQDACNEFRTELEHRGDGFPFGDRLYELRAAALLFASEVKDELKLPEAEALADKVDMSSAREPIGELFRVIHVPVPRPEPGSTKRS